MPVKQVMVKLVRKVGMNSVYWEKLVKLKAAESSRFLSQISAKIFKIGRILNSRLLIFEKLTASGDGC